MRLRGSAKNGVLIVKIDPNTSAHKHLRTQETWFESVVSWQTMNRKMPKFYWDTTWLWAVSPKLWCRCTWSTDDQANSKSPHQTRSKNYEEWNESENVQMYLGDLKSKYRVLSLARKIWNPKLHSILSSSHRIWWNHTEIAQKYFFIDGTYKANQRNYAMYVFMVEDGNGLAQVVGVGPAASKKGITEQLIQQFKRAHWWGVRGNWCHHVRWKLRWIWTLRAKFKGCRCVFLMPERCSAQLIVSKV